MADEQDLVRWAEALAGIARTGLGFTDSIYERERFEEILHIAAEIRACAGDEPVPSRRVEEWLDSVGEGIPGYVTPKLAIGAIVGNDDGEILLIKRADSGVWLFPTGWADVGYSAAEVAEKEVAEETGIDVEVVRLISVVDGLRQGFTRMPLYSLVFQCRVVGGELRGHPLEVTDLGFFSQDALPEPVAGLEQWVDHAFAAVRGEPIDVAFDRPRRPTWRNDGTRTDGGDGPGDR